MSSITSGVGLVSGLPINDLVNSLIAAQRGPITQLTNRVNNLSASRAAFLQVTAQLLSLRNSVSRLTAPATFRAAAATSSNESSILATAGAGTPPGQYTFTVRNLASTHQLISTGFATSDRSPVGTGTLTIESAAGKVNQSTSLSLLNGGEGVRAGRILVTDKSGSQATVDLVSARSISDVVSAINSASGVQVRASVEGNHLKIDDISGGGGSLTITDVGAGKAATDLGIVGTTASSAIVGRDIAFIGESTLLRQLNDGNGVRVQRSSPDFKVTLGDGSSLQFDLSQNLTETTPLSLLNSGGGVPSGLIRITDRSGSTAEIDLSGAQTVGDVIAAINANTQIDVEARVTQGFGNLTIKDTSLADGQDAAGSLLIEDVTGGAAEALGIAGSTDTNELKGEDVYFVNSVGDVLRLINDSPANAGRLIASISEDGLGIELTDTTGGPIQIASIGGSRTAQDLGLIVGTYDSSTATSRRLIAELDTVLVRSLNGGQGIDLGGLNITDRAGNGASVDLGGVSSLSDLIDAINASGTNVRASVSSSGLGVSLTDLTQEADATGNLVVSGITAVSLGIEANVGASDVRGRNLQRQYISEATRLEHFNGGVPRGKFKVTTSTGATAIVDLTQGDEQTIGDVLREISTRLGDNLTARINDTGDGIVVIDSFGGAGRLKIEESGGTVARALNILGTASAGEEYIDGSFEERIDVGASDSIDDVAAKIRDSGANVNVAVINDGSGNRPYRLSISAEASGVAGALALDGGATGLRFDTVSAARDAIVTFGPADADSPLVFSTSGNTLTNAVAGLRLNLVGASSEPVTVSVTRNQESVVTDVKAFVTAYNDAISLLDQLTSFDPESFDRGILQGDSTARRVRQSLSGLINRVVPGTESSFDRFSSVGIKFDTGGKIALDEDKLRGAIESDLDGVVALFTTQETNADGEVTRSGLAYQIQAEIDRLTDTDSGTIPLRDQSLETSETQLNSRISQLETLLNGKRDRLFAQFQNMESVIAQLQSQQSALGGLSSLAALSGN